MKNLFPHATSATAKHLLSGVLASLLLSSAAFAADHPPLTGTWNNGSEMIQEYDGKLTVFVSKRTRGPFFGWFTSSNSIAVSFTDDGGCCTATITGDGEVLRWSNGTKWVKD